MSRKVKSKQMVTTSNKPRANVQNHTVALGKNAQIWIDLRDSKWLSSVRNKKFTNFLISPESCIKSYFKILNEIIPKIQSEWENIKGRNHGYKHCHLLTGREKELAREIYYEIYNHQLDEEVYIWQFGFTGSTRLICIFNEVQNAFRPIFVDHNHIIYESQKHNQADYKKYNYCIVCAHK
ncbi:hypothetical protein SFC08_14760 [Lysinibacillus halotolerans]